MRFHCWQNETFSVLCLVILCYCLHKMPQNGTYCQGLFQAIYATRLW